MIPSIHFLFIFYQSRADAAEENIKLLTEKMKEKDKEVELAKVRINK